ncbi:MAG: ArsC family reductase [Congregibacter sp.]
MSVTLYGIKNCDTVRKARRWMDAQDIDYRFHDCRESELDRERVQDWVDAKGWEVVVNKRSTSWKALDVAARESMDATTAIDAVLAAPTLIKRPVLETENSLEFGFDASRYARLLG